MSAEESHEVTPTSGFWFDEEVSPVMSIRMLLKSILYNERSEFQYAQIIETGPFGKTLVLDSKTQSALADEYVYHESLVHPVMIAHPNPKTVFIGGGGELATAREVAKHPSVERIVMVDLDKTVVEICKKHMPEWHGGVIDDPRLELHYEDAKAWLENCNEKFDVIIMDIADPIEAGPGVMLYTEEFYNFIHKCLQPGGCFVTQSGPGSVMNATECFSVIYQTLKQSFQQVVPYTSDIPSFGCNWAFNMAFTESTEIVQKTKEKGEENPTDYLLNLPSNALDKLINERVKGDLRFLDGVSLKGILGVPKPVRQQLQNEKRYMTKDNPVYMY